MVFGAPSSTFLLLQVILGVVNIYKTQKTIIQSTGGQGALHNESSGIQSALTGIRIKPRRPKTV